MTAQQRKFKAAVAACKAAGRMGKQFRPCMKQHLKSNRAPRRK